MMAPLETLLAIEQIKQLKARYFRCMDTKDWEGFAAVFTADAVFDMRSEMRTGGDPQDGLVRGAAAIAAFVRGHVEPLVTVHHGHMPEIELLGPRHARGTWAMEDLLRWQGTGAPGEMRGYGHYHDTYERHEGGWLIASSRLTRLRVDIAGA
jgi:hypothetical protein